jgi:hypothetical protein
MEDNNKEQYFKYYQTRKPATDSCSRKKPQKKRHNHNKKILPHITEEYNYLITNYLLIKKIISPKRDKTILQSL